MVPPPSRSSSALLALSLAVAVLGAPAVAAAGDVSLPTPSPIRAVFHQSAYSTIYWEPLIVGLPKGVTVVYSWSLTMQADAGCAAGFKPGNPNVNYATWYHQDTSLGGPCDHTYYNDLTGHPGTVKLVVQFRQVVSRKGVVLETCDLAFQGTAPGNQVDTNPALGSDPTCTFGAPYSTTSTSTSTSTTTVKVSVKPKNSAIPKYTQAEKQKFKTVKHVYAFGGVALTVIAVLLVEVPPAALGVGLAAASLAADAEIMDIYSEDPPDPNFRVVATPTSVGPSTVSAPKMSGALSAAATALRRDILELRSTTAALMTSINRAQGARAAHQTTWYDRQMMAAKRYATACAGYLSAEPALRSALLAQLTASKYPLSATAARAAAARSRVAAHGFPADVVAGLRDDGLSASQVAALATSLQSQRGSVSAASLVASLDASDRSAAATLRAFAASI